jgi:hypothetical protein
MCFLPNEHISKEAVMWMYYQIHCVAGMIEVQRFIGRKFCAKSTWYQLVLSKYTDYFLSMSSCFTKYKHVFILGYVCLIIPFHIIFQRTCSVRNCHTINELYCQKATNTKITFIKQNCLASCIMKTASEIAIQVLLYRNASSKVKGNDVHVLN